MEAVKIGEEGSASMATNNRNLSIEDYLDFIKNRHHKLNGYQLRKVISMHGFSGIKVEKNILLDAVKTINLMDLRRSTLKDSSVSADACLTLTGVINDLNGLQWQGCHVTSVITQGGDRTVPLNRKKWKGLGKSLVEGDNCVFSITSGVEVAADDSISIIPTRGTSVDGGSKSVKGAVEVAGDVSVKRKKWQGLGVGEGDEAVEGSTISSESTSVAAIVSVKNKRLKGEVSLLQF